MENPIEGKIRKATEEVLADLGASAVNFAVEWPGDIAHGDYAVNAAMAAAKTLGKNPRELASELAPRIKEKLGSDIESVEVAGPGFINITLARDEVARGIREASMLSDEWGRNDSLENRRVMIEYSNPNPFKEIHVGHLMSNITGEALSRVIEASGATVLRDTFGGDVGPHVAKALWALRKDGVTDISSAQEIGAAYATGSSAYDEDPNVKQEIDELNTKLYDIVAAQEHPETLSDDDRTLLGMWRTGREISMEEFARIFTILGTKFDYTFYDSDTTEIGMRVVADLVENGILEKSEGAVIYRGEKNGLHTLVFITSRGTPTYETKDIGLAFLKEERVATDEILIVTAIEQVGHFNVVLAVLEEIAPLLAKKTKHIPHGLLRLTTGKMSSRKGNVITATELLEDMIARAGKKNPDPLIAEMVAVGAVKYMILRQSAGSDIIFDPETSLSLEGESGPYLQYALARAKSILTQAGEPTRTNDMPSEPYLIERFIIRFPEVVRRAQLELAPHHITHYLTQLASEWNSFYAKERIIGGDYESYKLELARAFIQTMQNGLQLLGIPTPERM